MKLFRGNKKPPGPTRSEALAGIPERVPAVTWQVLDNGEILLAYPLDIKPFFLQIAKRFSQGSDLPPTKKLQLDQMGSRVWQMFDGIKDVKTIITEVAELTGLSLLEAEQAVTTFLRQLGKRGLVVIR